MKYNEEVAYNLGLSLEDIYVLEKIENNIRDTNLSKDGNNGEFSFNQVDLFKMCKFVFSCIFFKELIHPRISYKFHTHRVNFTTI